MNLLEKSLGRRWVAIGVWCALVLTSTTAVADDELIEISEGQLDLNERGIEAVEDEEYERAIRLFTASLDLGELNITYVNLARVYQHAGDCETANEIYDQALQAPQVDEPAPDQIEAAIEMYRGEMEENCPGYLDVNCEPEEMALFLDGHGPLSCATDDPRELMPGSYALRGEFLDYDTQTTVEISAMEHVDVDLSLTDEELEEIERGDEEVAEVEEEDDALQDFEAPTVELEPDDPEETQDIEKETEDSAEEFAEVEAPPMPESSSGTKAFLLLTTSALSLGGAVALDTIPDEASNGEFDAINFVAVGLYGTALGLGIAGVRSAF